MTPKEIKILLFEAEITQTEIAKKLCVTLGFVNQVILGIRKTQYVRDAIAKAVGKPVEKLWPQSNHKRKAA
jgi:DNA-binding transcriptional regulator LsrR (DeoR family)